MNLCKCHFGRTLFAVCKTGPFKYLSCYFSAWKGKVTILSVPSAQKTSSHQPPLHSWQRQHQKLGLINFCLIAKFWVKMLVRLLGAAPPALRPGPPKKMAPRHLIRNYVKVFDFWICRLFSPPPPPLRQSIKQSAHLQGPPAGQFKF